MGTRRRGILVRAGLGLLVVAVLLQLVPYGRDHTNPPVTQDAPWPDGRSRELATAACYDCHSNQTRWPPQSFVAPFSWLLARRYVLAHPGAALSETERQDLVEALESMERGGGDRSGPGGGGDGEDRGGPGGG